MAKNLIKAGYPLVVHSRSQGPVQELVGAGAKVAASPKDVAGTYNPGFKIDLHFKDLGLIMESSRALGVPLPCTAVVQELFNAMRVKGKGGLDHSGVITLLEELAGLPTQS
jgi:2-hydroxy-3-oxopropionate reductase